MNKHTLKKLTQDILNTIQPDDMPFVCITESGVRRTKFDVIFYATETDAFAQWDYTTSDDELDGAVYCGKSVDFELYCGTDAGQ